MAAKCIKEEALMDFLEGRLSDGQRRRIETHLAGCDACVEDMLVVRQGLREEAIETSEEAPAAVTERAVRWVNTLGKGSLIEKVLGTLEPLAGRWSEAVNHLVSGGLPGLAPVRGSREDLDENLILLKKAFSDLDVGIELERKGGEKASIGVRLTRNDHPDRPVRVTLLRKEEEIASMMLGDSAAFFEGIPFGNYVLAFTRDGRRVGEYAFEIREKHHG